MMQSWRTVVGAAATLAISVGLLAPSVPASAVQATAIPPAPASLRLAVAAAQPVVASASSTLSRKTMKQVIAAAKKKNKKSFNWRYAKLKKAAALTAIIKKSRTKHGKLYRQFFAAISTKKQVSHLLRVTKGKGFEVSGTPSRPIVHIWENIKRSSTVAPADVKCVKGWIAFWAWWVGTEMTCVGFGEMVGVAMVETGPFMLAGGAIAGSSCAGLMVYLEEEFIDFNAACD